MYNTFIDGERDILTELNEDAFTYALLEWDNLTEEEQDALKEAARLEAEAADREAAFYWAFTAQQAR
jgi:hypothetical protein